MSVLNGSATLDGPGLAALLESVAGRRYDEAVDELTHALQTAYLASIEGADDALVLAAALHDAGRIDEVAERYCGPHEVAGARFVEAIVDERAGWVVGAHVDAKRYLVATDPIYGATLSPASVRSLAVQGGPFSSDEADAFAAHPWAHDAIVLRRWDDRAKEPGAPAMTVAEVVDRYERFHGRS